MKIRLLFCSILISSVFQGIDGQIEYSLKDCIDIGLERNYSILVARNSETISKNNYTLGNAGYLPTLDINSRYSGTINNTTQNLKDGSQNITNNSHTTTANAGATLGWTIFDGFNVRQHIKN